MTPGAVIVVNWSIKGTDILSSYARSSTRLLEGAAGGGSDGDPGSLRDDQGRLAALREKRALAHFEPGYRQIVENAVGRAEVDLLNPDCASLFGPLGIFNLPSPAEQLEDVFEAGRIRGYVFDSSFKSGVGGYTDPDSKVIYLATNRYFFTGILETGTSALLTDGFHGLTSLTQIQEVILIHELLHEAGVVGADNASQVITLPNGETVVGSAGVSQAVVKHCIH
jgi:hypothetical protein